MMREAEKSTNCYTEHRLLLRQTDMPRQARCPGKSPVSVWGVHVPVLGSGWVDGLSTRIGVSMTGYASLLCSSCAVTACYLSKPPSPYLEVRLISNHLSIPQGCRKDRSSFFLIGSGFPGAAAPTWASPECPPPPSCFPALIPSHLCLLLF